MQATLFKVTADVFQFFEFGQGTAQLGLPFTQLRQVIGFDAELVLRVRYPSTDADVLYRRHEQPCARLLGQLLAQSCHHLLGTGVALIARLERQEHAGGIALPLAGETRHRLYRGIGLHDGKHGVQALLHGLKRRTLVRTYKAVDAASVLLWEKALGNSAIQGDIEGDGRHQHQPHKPWVTQCPSQAMFVNAQPFAAPRSAWLAKLPR